MDEYAQSFPNYDGADQGHTHADDAQGTNKRKRKSGKLSREGELRKKRKWRAKNASKYRAYMRNYMSLRRRGSGYAHD